MALMWNHEIINVNGIDIHYVRHGAESAQMLLILLHGWPEFWYAYRKNVPTLEKHFDVVVPDLRGFGNSEKLGLPDPTSSLLDILVADLLSLADALQLEHFGLVNSSGVCQETPSEAYGVILLQLCLPGDRQALARARDGKGTLVSVV